MKQSPEFVFEELFSDLHLSGLWEDGKLITDAIPRNDASEILRSYREKKDSSGFDLRSFFEDHFIMPKAEESGFESDTSRSLEDHIEILWDVLSRESRESIKGSSALPLPFPYIVPGGRFNEIYYWDSYFTMLGLKASGRDRMIENMLDNFSYMIDNFGFIPNGSRTYFLSRSQPPYFSLMVDLLASMRSEDILLKYHDQMLREYAFWMDSCELLTESSAKSRVVKINDVCLNRYFDNLATARPEMYGADIHLSNETERSQDDLFRNLRAACESGWDFSSRWLKDSLDLSSIHCSEILAVDLNCLMYHLELMLSRSSGLKGSSEESNLFRSLAELRAKTIAELFWDSANGFFYDYNWKEGSICTVQSLAGVYPLYFKLASQEQAESVASILEKEFLKNGGLTTTCIHSGQQWDAPNGWAPLQWMAIYGLRNYGFDRLAEEIKQRWIGLNEKVYKNTGKLLEKYNVVDTDLLSGGGEYPVQDGFGWTNGVLLSLLKED